MFQIVYVYIEYAAVHLGMNSQNIMLTHIFTFIAVVVKKHVSCLTWTLPKSTWIGICGSCALSIVYTWVTNSDVPFKRRKAKGINTLWMFECLLYYSIYDKSISKAKLMFYYLPTEGKKSHFDLPTQVKFQHVGHSLNI